MLLLGLVRVYALAPLNNPGDMKLHIAIRPEIWAYISSRRVLARLFSTILCAVIVVIHPISKYGGAAAFLALTVKELVFSVQENLAQQLEATILHSVGGLAGIGLSVIGKYLSTLASDPVVARLIPALFLVGICFFGMSIHNNR